MIRLAGHRLQYKTTINHTGTNSSADYVVTHNLGTKNIEVDMWDPAENSQIVKSIYQETSNVYGFAVHSLDLNSCTIRIWLWQYSPASLHSANKTVEVTISAV